MMIKQLPSILIIVFLFTLCSGNAQVVSDTYPAIQGIKIDIFGPFRGYSQISYEKVLTPTQGYEVSVGIIGLGKNLAFPYSDTVVSSRQDHQGQFGFFLSAGYKFNKLPLFETSERTDVPIMQGAYAKPIFYIGEYQENRINRLSTNKYELQRPTTTFATLEVELGKQWIVYKKIPIDIYGGIGYCIDNKQFYSTSYYDLATSSAFNFCNDRIGKSPGISFTFGIKTGILLR